GTWASHLPHVLPLGGKFGGPTHRQDEAGLTGDALTGDVEGGAVVHRDTHHGQARGDVDPVVAVDRLEGCVPLVVVADRDQFPFALNGGGDEGVGGQRAVGVDVFGAGLLDRGCQDIGVLIPEQAVLPGVRVE